MKRLERTTEELRHKLWKMDRAYAGRASDVPPGFPSMTRKDRRGVGEGTGTGSADSSGGASTRP